MISRIYVRLGMMAFSFLGIFILYYFAGSAQPYDSSAEMEKHLINWEGDFNLLVTMTKEESGIQSINNNFIMTEMEETLRYPEDAISSFPIERWRAYRKLFVKLHAKGGMEIGSNGMVYLTVSMRPDNNGMTEKGYLHTLKPPSPLRETLEDITLADTEESPVHYKHVKGNWYIFHARQY